MIKLTRPVWAASAAFSVLVACGGSGKLPDGGLLPPGGGGPLPPAQTVTTLTVTPANAVLHVTAGTAVTSSYTAVATYGDGHTADVTATAAFTVVDPSLGTFDKNAFNSTSLKGGQTTIQAFLDGVEGDTGVTVLFSQSFSDTGSGVPANPGTFFGGVPSASAGNPTLVYPNDNILVPPNLGRLEFHFNPGSGNNLFEVSFENEVSDFKVYLRCTALNGGCVYLPTSDVWSTLTGTNRGRLPLVIHVRGTSDAGGAPVGQSADIHLQFAYDDLQGGIYYWTTTQPPSIIRFDFASSQTTGELFADNTIATGHNTDGNTGDEVACIGCHALSHDGTRMIAETEGQGNGHLLFMDVASKSLLTPFDKANGGAQSIFESWSPDGSQFVGTYSDYGDNTFTGLKLFSGTTAGLVGTIASTKDDTHPADHADWSPDGNSITYTQVGTRNSGQTMWGGAIAVVSRAGSDWGTPTTIVPHVNGKNRYYPAFSPDSKSIVFDEATCIASEDCDQGHCTTAANTSCNANLSYTATLFITPADGSQVQRLDAANAPGVSDQGTTNLTNTYPKWSPFVSQHTATDPGSKVQWMTFASSRSYGLRGAPPQTSTWLWMVAIDPDKVGTGQDPSYGAFLLPFQDLSTSNHIAQWTTRVVDTCTQPGVSCTASDLCCFGLQCLDSQGGNCGANESCTCTADLN